EGDYVSTGDNVIPPQVNGQAWETPATINHTWGFRKDDTDWKSPGQIIFKLVDIVSKGGNYLLNVGPMSDGIIPPASQEVLRSAGHWLQANGDAIYGASPTPFGDELGEISKTLKDIRGEPLGFVQSDYRYTAKPGKLYITFFTEPRVPFPLPRMKNTVTRASYLGGDQGAVPVKVRTENGRTFLDIERPLPDPMASVVVVEISGSKVEPMQ
ncbi:MAG TPA: alpha-L-fucosidase, partial [Vicinamibacterales bacterium]|nr:alpha-L-fucosidase [Vicinamibacterales bacterium]